MSQLESDVSRHGDLVRQLKSDKAEKDKVNAAVAQLLDMKNKLCLAQGIEQGFLQQSHFPIFGNEKSQPIPTSGILFLNQFPKMGTKVSTNSQCGKIKFNQFPVSNGNKIFNQFPVGGN